MARSTWPHTPQDAYQKFIDEYDDSIAKGEFQPLVYPFLPLGATILIVYLLIPHKNRPWLRNARFAVFAALLANALYTIRYYRARNFAASMVIGLVSSWSILWAAAILLCNDAQSDFWRIQRVGGTMVKDEYACEKQAIHRKAGKEGDGELKNRSNDSAHDFGFKQTVGPSQRSGEFAWQSFPTLSLMERVDWVMDLYINFRGAGWNWRPIPIAPPPKSVQTQLVRNTLNPPPNHSFREHSSQTYVFPTRRALLIKNAKDILIAYLFIDWLKVVADHDPYFWGLIDSQPAPYFPFATFLSNNPILLRMIRLLISQFGLMWGLKAMFAIPPLLYAGLLGPSRLGARAEPWMYPETWGSYMHVLDKGLAGWWGAWWHQTFRFGFEQPGRKIIELTGLNPKKNTARILQLAMVFGLSGVLHASGSYTCHGETQPLQGPMTFFLLQAVAMFVEAFLRPALVKSRLPEWLKKCLTFVYVHVWFYHTAGLLCDDIARGGIWLLEPLPVTIFRGPLVLGGQGSSWFFWDRTFLRWHSAEKWWMSGIAF